MIQENAYEKKAQDFLQKTDTVMIVAWVKYDKHFDDDKDKRDIYQITLKRGARLWSFAFGQSVVASGKYILAETGERVREHRGRSHNANKYYEEPGAYAVLAAITKYDVGTLKNFCDEFGYDVDSKKAEKTYGAVCQEWQNVQKLWTDAEIEALQEIR